MFRGDGKIRRMFVVGPFLKKEKKRKSEKMGYKEFADMAMCFMGPTWDIVSPIMEGSGHSCTKLLTFTT